MRQFLDEVGSSSDDEEETKTREGEQSQEELMEEEDADLAKIDKKVERLTKEEQAEVKR